MQEKKAGLVVSHYGGEQRTRIGTFSRLAMVVLIKEEAGIGMELVE